MRALQNPGAHIPYRESTLTSVLRNSLGGECRTVFVVTLSLDSEDLAETVASCRCVRYVYDSAVGFGTPLKHGLPLMLMQKGGGESCR